MTLVEGHVKDYAEVLRAKKVRKEVRRHQEWTQTISEHFDIIMKRLGVPLCGEIGLVVSGYESEHNYNFPCTLFDLPCIVQVCLPIRTSDPLNATLRFTANIGDREVYSYLPPGEALGRTLYELKEKVDKIHIPLAMRERVWFPYYYYELTYGALCREEDGYFVDTFTADVVSAEPDKDGWYYVLNFAYASEERNARPTRFTNVVKIERRLAEEPNHYRDRLFSMTDEKSGAKYKVYRPRGGVEAA